MVFIKKIYKKFLYKKYRSIFKRIGENCNIASGLSVIGAKYIEIGECFTAGRSLSLQVWDSYNEKGTGYTPMLKIGNNVSFMSGCHISCANKVLIEDGVLFGDNVFVTDNFHGNNYDEELDVPPLERKLRIKDPVIIKKNVWIGRNVCIMPGVVIGEGAIIGANAVVTKSIPNKTIAAGVPAKVVRSIH